MVIKDVLLHNNIHIDIKSTFHRIKVDKEYKCPFRSTEGIAYYLKGSMNFNFENKTIVTHKDEMIYIPYGSNYNNFVNDPETEYYQIDFSIYENDKIVPLFNSPRLYEKSDSLNYKNLISQIMIDNTRLDNTKKYACFANFCKLIDIMYSQDVPANYAAFSRIKNSIEYIEQNYRLNTSIEDIAAMSSTCVANFERLFKLCFNMTPSTYRNMVRINAAKQLLLSGLSIEETAFEVGFHDSFHFSKTFKKITGITPGKYAKGYHTS